MKTYLSVSLYGKTSVVMRKSESQAVTFICIDVGESTLWLYVNEARELAAQISEKIAEAEAETVKEQAA